MAAMGRMVAAQAVVVMSLLSLLKERGGIPITDVHGLALAAAERQRMGPEVAALVNGILLPPDSAGASH